MIAISLFFIILTTPGAVCSQFYYDLVRTVNGKLILFACDSITFSYHALNIIFLSLSNKEFYTRLVKTILRKRDKIEISNITTNNALYYQTNNDVISTISPRN